MREDLPISLPASSRMRAPRETSYGNTPAGLVLLSFVSFFISCEPMAAESRPAKRRHRESRSQLVKLHLSLYLLFDLSLSCYL